MTEPSLPPEEPKKKPRAKPKPLGDHECFRGNTALVRLNRTQERFLRRCIGASRWVYNAGVIFWNQHYRTHGKSPTQTELYQHISEQSQTPELAWLLEIPTTVIAQSLMDLRNGYTAFFAQAQSNVGRPVLKTKQYTDTCRFQLDPRHLDRTVIPFSRLCHQRKNPGAPALRVKLQGLDKPLEFRLTRDCSSKSQLYTFGFDAMGRCQVRFMTREPKQVLPAPLYGPGSVLALDVNTKAMVFSNGHKIDTRIDVIRAVEKRRKRYQRQYAHKKNLRKSRLKTSPNRATSVDRFPSNHERAVQQKIQQCYTREKNIRAAVHAEVITYAMTHAEVIAIETLHVKGMMKNTALANTLNKIGFGAVLRSLQDKPNMLADATPRWVIACDRWDASSKTCHVCKIKNPNLTLRDREWTCTHCQTRHDRDINAAINIALMAWERAGSTTPVPAPTFCFSSRSSGSGVPALMQDNKTGGVPPTEAFNSSPCPPRFSSTTTTRCRRQAG